jgi:prepilin-type N-terminal cleavage/methylation domain-containing protein
MNQHGFTLVELLLSVAIMTMLIGLSLPVYETFVRRNDLDLTTQNVASAIRRAEVYARGVKNDSTWSVEFLSSGITIFKGPTYSTRDTSYDETVSLPGSVSISGDSEMIFSKLSGTPDAAGTVTLTSSANDTRTVVVNAKGMVSY